MSLTQHFFVLCLMLSLCLDDHGRCPQLYVPCGFKSAGEMALSSPQCVASSVSNDLSHCLCVSQEHEEGGAAKSVEAKEGKELFHSRAVLFEAPDGRLQPGRYRFPFLFVLPPELPGSASVAGADVGKDEAGESVAFAAS